MNKIFKSFMVLLFSLLFLFTISGCGESREFYPDSIPRPLADCSFYKIKKDLSYLYVVRCPNSDTSVTYRSGKTDNHISTIDR